MYKNLEPINVEIHWFLRKEKKIPKIRFSSWFDSKEPRTFEIPFYARAQVDKPFHNGTIIECALKARVTVSQVLRKLIHENGNSAHNRVGPFTAITPKDRFQALLGIFIPMAHLLFDLQGPVTGTSPFSAGTDKPS